MLYVSELFSSVQGEGPRVGTPSIFVRFEGCFLRCKYCDSKFSWMKHKDHIMTSDEIRQLIDSFSNGSSTRDVIFTGGEPLMYLNNRDFVSLVTKLLILGYNISFETTMIYDPHMVKSSNVIQSIKDVREKLISVESDRRRVEEIVWIISPKLEPSCYSRFDTEITQSDILRYYTFFEDDYLDCNRVDFYYKFVHDEQNEGPLLSILTALPKQFVRKRVFIMPKTPIGDQFNEEAFRNACLTTVEFCKKYGFRFSPRIHINLWGLKNGV